MKKLLFLLYMAIAISPTVTCAVTHTDCFRNKNPADCAATSGCAWYASPGTCSTDSWTQINNENADLNNCFAQNTGDKCKSIKGCTWYESIDRCIPQDRSLCADLLSIYYPFEKAPYKSQYETQCKSLSSCVYIESADVCLDRPIVHCNQFDNDPTGCASHYGQFTAATYGNEPSNKSRCVYDSKRNTCDPNCSLLKYFLDINSDTAWSDACLYTYGCYISEYDGAKQCRQYSTTECSSDALGSKTCESSEFPNCNWNSTNQQCELDPGGCGDARTGRSSLLPLFLVDDTPTIAQDVAKYQCFAGATGDDTTNNYTDNTKRIRMAKCASIADWEICNVEPGCYYAGYEKGCKPCQAGSYCPGSTYDGGLGEQTPSTTPCPSITVGSQTYKYTSKPGAASSAECYIEWDNSNGEYYCYDLCDGGGFATCTLWYDPATGGPTCTNPDGGSGVTGCGPGKGLSADGKTCEDCPIGSFSANGELYCTKCEDKTNITGVLATGWQTAPEEYPPVSVNQCFQSCKTGMPGFDGATDFTGNVWLADCDGKGYINVWDYDCKVTECAPGYTFGNIYTHYGCGSHDTFMRCEKCPANKISPGGNTSEAECKSCTNATSNDGITCQCDPGYYPDESDPTSCKPCDTGHYCTGNRIGMQECAAGTYQDEPGKKTCKPCKDFPGGNAVCTNTGTVTPTKCEDYQIPNANYTQCIECTWQPSQTSNTCYSGKHFCHSADEDVPTGAYPYQTTDAENKTICALDKCPGFSTSDAGAQSITDCYIGGVSMTFIDKLNSTGFKLPKINYMEIK